MLSLQVMGLWAILGMTLAVALALLALDRYIAGRRIHCSTNSTALSGPSVAADAPRNTMQQNHCAAAANEAQIRSGGNPGHEATAEVVLGKQQGLKDADLKGTQPAAAAAAAVRQGVPRQGASLLEAPAAAAAAAAAGAIPGQMLEEEL
jgi:hypothetical protein